MRKLSLDTSQTYEQRRAALYKRFDRRVVPKVNKLNLPSASSTTLTHVFDAARLMPFSLTSNKYAKIMIAAGEELSMRGSLDKKRAQELHDILLIYEYWDKARDLMLRYPDIGLEFVPQVFPGKNIQAGLPRILVPSPDGSRFILQSVDIRKGPHIVAATHPLCGPSGRSTQALTSDPEISPIFSKHVLLVVPAGRSINLRSVLEWNQSHPHMPYSYIYRQRDWHPLQMTGTPEYYFFLDGEKKYELIGWPRPGRREEFIEGLKAIGLWPDRGSPGPS